MRDYDGGRPGGRSSVLNHSRSGRNIAHSRPTRCAGKRLRSINWRTVLGCRPSSSAAWVTDTISTVRRMTRFYPNMDAVVNVDRNHVDIDVDSDKIDTNGLWQAYGHRRLTVDAF